jgi:exopolysaccharide biosynthesis WecB/TagA/CpsF family protein
MIDFGKKNILGVSIAAVDYEMTVESIIKAARERCSMGVTAVAVHGVMTGFKDKEHRYRLNHLDMVVPDGQPVRWALNILHGARLQDRVYGPTLMLKVCERAASEGLPIFLFGSEERVLSLLECNLIRRFPMLRVVGCQPSKFRCVSDEEKRDMARKIMESGAAIVFVGLGCPRQEVWVYENLSRIPLPLIAVGAAFNFHAGLLPQAPPRLQRMGLEWLYRLYREPRRLWRRYLYLNPTFIACIALQWAGIKEWKTDDIIQPKDEIGFA